MHIEERALSITSNSRPSPETAESQKIKGKERKAEVFGNEGE